MWCIFVNNICVRPWLDNIVIYGYIFEQHICIVKKCFNTSFHLSRHHLHYTHTWVGKSRSTTYTKHVQDLSVRLFELAKITQWHFWTTASHRIRESQQVSKTITSKLFSFYWDCPFLTMLRCNGFILMQWGKQTYYRPAKGWFINSLIIEFINQKKKILSCDSWKIIFLLH